MTLGLTRWYFNGTLIALIDDGSGNPYSRDTVPSTLIIPSFVAPHNGTYSCESGHNFYRVPSLGDNITLTLPGMHV